MTLPYLSKPAYLSPSALKNLESDPLRFYLQRCAGKVLPKEPQSLYMAVGSAFDALVKDEIDRQLVAQGKQAERRVYASVLLQRQVSDEHREVATDRANRIFKSYLKLGAVNELLEEGIDSVDPETTQPENMGEVPATAHELLGRKVAGIPIRGHPDAAGTDADQRTVVHDWKLTGGDTDTQKEGAEKPSPHPGYRRLLDTKRASLFHAPHARCDEPLEALNFEWASQLATYHWLLRPGVGRGYSFLDSRVSVDQVLVFGDHVRVAKIRTHVSGFFQKQLRERYIAAWKRIQEESLVDDKILTSLDPKTLALLA